MAFPASIHTLADEEGQSTPTDLDLLKQKTEDDIDNHHNDTPLKFVPLQHVYSTAPCVTGSSALPVSKKIRARRVTAVADRNNYQHQLQQFSMSSPPHTPPHTQTPSSAVMFYSRRPQGFSKPSFFDKLVEKFDPQSKKRALEAVKPEPLDGQEDDREGSSCIRYKRTKLGNEETLRLRSSSSRLRRPKEMRVSGSDSICNSNGNIGMNLKKTRKNNSMSVDAKQEDDPHVRKWVQLAMEGVCPKTFVGLQCQVYWPLDDEWYNGSIVAYDSESKEHNIAYEDGEEEDLVLSREKIKFHLSMEEMLRLNLNLSNKCRDDDLLDYSELLVSAASMSECHELEPGEIVWAKLTGHAMWPAVIVDESRVGERKGLNKHAGSRSVPVQFFGTHDFARIQGKHTVSFLRGLLCSYHLKCKSARFQRGLKEANNYMNEQKLPKNMVNLQCASVSDDGDCQSEEDDRNIDARQDCTRYDARRRALGALPTTPLTIGDLQIMSFGEIVRDSVYFSDERTAWPLGYTAFRKFASIKDPSVTVSYKMEVLRDSESKVRPLFRVTVDGEQFKGGSPSACWSKIFRRMGKMPNDVSGSDAAERKNESGAEMYGFTNTEVLKVIKSMSNTTVSSEPAADKSLQRNQSMPAGYRSVHIDWKDLDRCSVCHMDDEYETNLFLQCDKCRIMVHARCYGEDFVDGKLWLCNLCRPGAPEFTPPCCLCPVVGGALKPTSDGRWAHLACAIWIPETCLNDIKKMEPIDGLNRINKDRWKLLCSICGVSYGACIQCSNNNCRVSYHPLCARAAGLCVEPEDEDRLHLIPFDEDEEDQCIRLLSFCKRHQQRSNQIPSVDAERVGHIASQCSNYSPPSNPSGCARCEPYDRLGRRGRKEPEALAAASVKRLYLENRPYLVGGYSLHESLVHVSPLHEIPAGSKFSCTYLRDNTSILSVSEKYTCMRRTFRKRLAFGKSRIHGFGIFAKQPLKAGDMVIEYTGEVVRPPVADRRERFIYNSLVGAGTYMFRIDNERVIDATRAGSVAHLINHSCEPNCYSRVITVYGDEHIIIFAKRDIQQWEELTYDYRFFSIDEQLPCYCGFPLCRGVVNDVEAEAQTAKLYAPCSELVELKDGD